eukprot:jgi/Phyca11/118320/e_gw1.36.173.1
MYRIDAYYSGKSCGETPFRVYSNDDPTCVEGVEIACTTTASGYSSQSKCSTDYLSTMRSMFGSSQYIIQETFNDSICSIFAGAFGYSASGHCEGPNATGDFYDIATLDINGQSSVIFYDDMECSSEPTVTQFALNSTLLDHSCDKNKFKWYSSVDDLPGASSSSGSASSSLSSTGLSTGAIIGIGCGAIAILLVSVLGIGCVQRRRRIKETQSGHTELDHTTAIDVAFRGKKGLWDDDVITAKRIPRDKVIVKNLLSRGAYGEVYNGVYNRQEVAVKMLLSSTRGNIQHVNDFLAEAKLTATMDHPHIVTFIGVAWDSLSNVCVVLEFMDGGDLRTLLASYEATKRPVGFNKQKATIALHVCHALTYLHSLMPPVIHRDLKSRNILLNRNLEAKLTDFGVSKERLDQTMTAGVGTSLWMAPEVMMSERYDVKADIFSFGVVLSELDVHTLPYTQTKERSLASTGRKMADATLLQKVTAGEVQVEFSDSIPRSLLELGLACVSVDPLNRPTAAEALYRLQVILAQDLA